jgi:4-amino-4-deoxy-L-arabinose transferase-like glycosyltransferase
MEQRPNNDRRLERFIFLAFLVVRLAFTVFAWKVGLELDRDSELYDRQSTAVVEHGDFDFQATQFTMAPLYASYQALHKWIFGAYWKWSLGIIQLVLCAYTGVLLFRIAKKLFDRTTGLVAAAIYCVFPLTLVWVNTFAQDMPFQIHLIFFFYVFLVALERDSWKWTFLAATLFAITFLTKSHILLFAPFIPLIIWLNMRTSAGRRIGHIVLFSLLSFAYTLPYGLYQYNKNGMYVLSSTGQGGHFLWGHNEDVYRFIVEPKTLSSEEYRRIFNMDYMVLRELRDTLDVLPIKERQAVFMDAALEWCRENPEKVRKLALYDLYYFLMPGVNPNHYSFMNWLAMFVLSLPLYILAYWGIVRAWRRDFRKHLFMLGLLITMLVFSVGFYVQNRFRTITLEPFYIIYAGSVLVWLGRKYRFAERFPRLGKLAETTR